MNTLQFNRHEIFTDEMLSETGRIIPREEDWGTQYEYTLHLDGSVTYIER